MSAMLPFDVEVREVNRLSENFVRITFCGAELDRFGVHGPTYDLRVKVMVPGVGPGPDYKQLLQSPTWYSEWKQLDPDTRGYMRTYTAREYRAGADPQLDVDFVMHLGDSAGPASAWASQAAVGDRLTLIGAHRDHPAGRAAIEWRAQPGQRVLIAGDETAVPAICAIVETLAPDTVGDVVVEVPSADDIQTLRAPAGVGVRWLARDGAAHGSLLSGAVRKIVRPAAADAPVQVDDEGDEMLWESAEVDAAATGTPYAWIAGESSSVKAIRRYLVGECGWDRKSVSFMGYWRRGHSESI
ncbi:SIP domain-containing protein [Epidermidibacterium keratini]|uniref:SIP domain-containing protein n=1 Tax=Epidermidibacterium keratini TaxID=1891644 RepID=A0A7L4YP70_9ACTN|nr:siderophore-interacting protein [Epidermidibacterium keratini]QHC00357.1 SIP domain-containing protein [Epidermidibacterium keratini]